MDFEWDEAKRIANLKKHGVDFADAEEFDWMGAEFRDDQNAAYGEDRYRALGNFRNRIHVVIFMLRGATTRIISFRPAVKREIREYEKAKDQSR